MSVNTCSCLEPACIAAFKTIEEADEHIDTGHHIFTPEKETKYDNVRRQWAAVMTSVNVDIKLLTDCIAASLVSQLL